MTDFPLFDMVGDTTAILMVKRPIVALSPWISTAIRTATDAGLSLQLVTPPTARLTMPLYNALTDPYLRWVVGHDNGFYDGLTGLVLHFDGTAFTVTGDPELAELYRCHPAASGRTLTIGFRIRHAPTESTVLGHATELIYEAFTGSPPSGWGTSEPIALTWRPAEVTRYCRERSPQPTHLCHAGNGRRPVIGTTLLTLTDAGIEEQTSIHISITGDIPLGVLSTAVADLATEHDLLELVAHTRPGRADLTIPPAFMGLPVPIGIALGEEAARQIGGHHDHAAPGVTASRIGDRRGPGVWYLVGDGTTIEAWPALADLLQVRPNNGQTRFLAEDQT